MRSLRIRSSCLPPRIFSHRRCRLAIPNPQARTILAERDDEVVGLARMILGHDATWGAFIDNLHVAHGLKRHGIGTRLLALTAQAILDWSPSSGRYLWVPEQKQRCPRFLRSTGRCLHRARRGPTARRRRCPAQRQADGPEICRAGPIETTCRSPIACTRTGAPRSRCPTTSHPAAATSRGATCTRPVAMPHSATPRRPRFSARLASKFATPVQPARPRPLPSRRYSRAQIILIASASPPRPGENWQSERAPCNTEL